jgi:hypothetical protein
LSSKRLDRIEALQEQIYELQERMHERIRDIDVALIVREPGTARAAEAYEGLRKSVATAARERRQHLAQLVEIADAIERGASLDTLRQRCEQWCMEAGLERRSDVVPEWFSVVEGEGPVLEVIAPAWVDSASGQLVKQGTARRGPGEVEHAAAPASPAPAPAVAAAGAAAGAVGDAPEGEGEEVAEVERPAEQAEVTGQAAATADADTTPDRDTSAEATSAEATSADTTSVDTGSAEATSAERAATPRREDGTAEPAAATEPEEQETVEAEA